MKALPRERGGCIVPRRPATITQADVARAIRAAKQEGWRSVRIITPTGATIEIGETPDIHRQNDEGPKIIPLGAL